MSVLSLPKIRFCVSSFMYYVYVFSGQYKTSILKLSLVIAIEIQFLGSANLIFKKRIEKTQERAKTQHESKCMLHFGDFTKNVALMLTSWESLLLSPNTQLYQRFQKKKHHMFGSKGIKGYDNFISGILNTFE